MTAALLGRDSTGTLWVLLDTLGGARELAVTPRQPFPLTKTSVHDNLPMSRLRPIQAFGHLPGRPYGLSDSSRVVWAKEMSGDEARRNGLPAPGTDERTPFGEAWFRTMEPATAKAWRAVHDTVQAYVKQAGLAVTGPPVGLRVLLSPDFRPLRVAHGPAAPATHGDSIVVEFVDALPDHLRGLPPRERRLRWGVADVGPVQGLPPGSRIGWAQASPPKVVQVERR